MKGFGYFLITAGFLAGAFLAVRQVEGVELAPFIGALFESFLHAALPAGRRFGNLANLINTLAGALLALALHLLID